MSLQEIKWDLPIITLIVANIIPIIGIIFLKWSLLYILLFYWMESAVIGFFNIIKMYMSKAMPVGVASYYSKNIKGYNKATSKFTGIFMKIIFPPFFMIHYGGFMAAHLIFIFAISAGFNSINISEFQTAGAILTSILIPLLALVISHGFSFFTNFIGKKEYLKVSIAELMILPYKRVIIMHITLLIGGFIMIITKAPVYVLILFILLKIFIDVKAHNKEHLKIELK